MPKITIPPNVVEAEIPDEVLKAFEDEFHFGEGDWKPKCIAAAINAWPGAFATELEDHTGVYRKITLPLPKGESDD